MPADALKRTLALVLAPLLAGCSAALHAARHPASVSHGPRSFAPPGNAGAQFVDVTDPAGITFRHNNGAFGKKLMPETTGAGCAFLDFDNDGWEDILFVNS